jgi:hypothetical protein
LAWHSKPRPTIELMRSININELRHAIPRYSNKSTSPMSALNISTLPVCVFPPPASKSLTISGAYKASISYGYRPISADIVLYWCAVAAVAVLFDYPSATALTPAAITKAVYASQKNNQIGRKRIAASKLRLHVGGLPDMCEPMPSQLKWTRRKTYQRTVTKSKPSKPQPRHDASARQ